MLVSTPVQPAPRFRGLADLEDLYDGKLVAPLRLSYGIQQTTRLPGTPVDAFTLTASHRNNASPLPAKLTAQNTASGQVFHLAVHNIPVGRLQVNRQGGLALSVDLPRLLLAQLMTLQNLKLPNAMVDRPIGTATVLDRATGQPVPAVATMAVTSATGREIKLHVNNQPIGKMHVDFSDDTAQEKGRSLWITVEAEDREQDESKRRYRHVATALLQIAQELMSLTDYRDLRLQSLGFISPVVYYSCGLRPDENAQVEVKATKAPKLTAKQRLALKAFPEGIQTLLNYVALEQLKHQEPRITPHADELDAARRERRPSRYGGMTMHLPEKNRKANWLHIQQTPFLDETRQKLALGEKWRRPDWLAGL